MTQSSRASEKRALTLAKWANLLMGVAGVIGAITSRSDALLVDGLYSAVNFVAAIIAGRVAHRVTLPPDRSRPWGYAFEETVYVTFRSLTLIGILLFAAFSSGSKLVTFATGGDVPDLIFGPIIVYAIAMVVICTGLAIYHHRAFVKSGRTSAILKTEARAAAIDGGISLGTGLALLSLPFLKETPLAPFVPVGDAVIVLIVVIAIVWQPLGIFRGAIAELTGISAPAATVRKVSKCARGLASERGYRFHRAAVQRAGRSHFVVIYVDPQRPVEASEIDDFWRTATSRLSDLVGPVQVEVVVTEIADFDVD